MPTIPSDPPSGGSSTPAGDQPQAGDPTQTAPPKAPDPAPVDSPSSSLPVEPPQRSSDAPSTSDSQHTGGGHGGGTVTPSPSPTPQSAPTSQATTPNSPVPPDVVSFAPDNIDGPFTFPGFDTGGSFLATRSSSCRLSLCHAQAGLVGLLGRAAAARAHQRPPLTNGGGKAQELSPLGLPWAPGPLFGQIFSFFGGGGPGAPLLLIGLAVLLVGSVMRVPDWKRAFRFPTATWRLSTYVPPLESPG